MRRTLVTLALLLVAASARAQHVDLVAAVKAQLQARGLDLSGPCGSFAIVKRVAWQLRAEGAGVLLKPDGENCNGYAKDILAWPNGMVVDILIAAGDPNGNGPAWQVLAPVEPSRWRSVIWDPDSGLATSPGPLPAPIPPPAPVPGPAAPPLLIDPGLLERLASIEAKQDALKLQLQAHDESPTWIRRFSSSPVGIAIYSFVGTCLPTKCWRVK